MYNTTMYQQGQLFIHISEDQIRQHYPVRDHKDMNGDLHLNLPMQEVSHEEYHHHNNNNNRHNRKKHNNWVTPSNQKNLRMLPTYHVPQSVPPPPLEGFSSRPPSRESQIDSSTEDLHDLHHNHIHEQHQYPHTYTLTMSGQVVPTYQPARSHSPQHGYQHQHKRRYQNQRFGSPPHHRRNNKYPANNMVNYQPAPDRYLARSKLVEVKDTPDNLVTGSKWDQLSTEVWNKFISNQQTTENYVNKMNLFKHLYNIIKKVLRYSVFVVGSTFNGFGTNSSDLDLCLVVRNPPLMDARTEAIQNLMNTRCILCLHCLEIQSAHLIVAKVPLLKFHHSCGVDVDINYNNCVGIHNTHLLHCYAKADWRVQPLVLVVKLWAQVHGINDARNMTISSYSLALMVIHFLQCGTMPAVLPCLQEEFPEKFCFSQEIHNINIQETLELPPTSNTQSLGELLLQFLDYYNNFNFEEDAISVRLGTTLPIDTCRQHQSPKNEPRAWTYLCIEEPFDHTNTARSVYDIEKFEHIKKVFLISHQRLKETQLLESIFNPNIINT